MIHRRPLIQGLALSPLFARGSYGEGSGQPIPIDMSQWPLDSPPPDFEAARTGSGDVGQWLVVADDTAAQGRAIAQIGADPTDYRFPLAIYKPVIEENVEVAIRLKPIAGRIDRAGGVAVRLINSERYYVARANALENNVNLYRVVDGKRRQIAGVNARVKSGEWHELGLRARGDRFTVLYEGKELFTATDATIRGAGRIALWTKADSVTRFDNIRIQRLT